jgi:hypothetical protein
MHMPNQMLPVRAHGMSIGVQGALHEVWIVVCLAAVRPMRVHCQEAVKMDDVVDPLLWHHNQGASMQWQFRLPWPNFGSYCTSSPSTNIVPGAWRRVLCRRTRVLHFPNVARHLNVDKGAQVDC